MELVNSNLIFWKKMRDDIIIVWKQGDIKFDRFYWYLMGIEPKIKFTMEREKNGIQGRFAGRAQFSQRRICYEYLFLEIDE